MSLLHLLILLLAMAPVITGAGQCLYIEDGHPLRLFRPENIPSISLLAIFAIIALSSTLRVFFVTLVAVVAAGIRDAGKPCANNAMIRDLERRLAEYQSENEKLTTKLHSKDAELEEERTAFLKACKKAEQMNITLTIQEEEIERLNDKLKANTNQKLQDYIAELEHMVKDKDLEILEHLQDVDDAKSLLGSTKRAKDAKITDLTDRLSSAHSQIDSFSLTIKDLEHEARDHAAEKASLTLTSNKFLALVSLIHWMIEQTANTLTREVAAMFLLLLSQNDFNIVDLSVDPRKLENLVSWLKSGVASGLRDPGSVKLDGYQFPLSRIVVGSLGISSGLRAPMMDKHLAQVQMQQQQQQYQQPAPVFLPPPGPVLAPTTPAPAPSPHAPLQQPMKLGKYVLTPSDDKKPAATDDKSVFGMFGGGKKEEYEEDENGRPVRGGGKKRRM